ncbi:B3 DNA binding domain - like 10 [Theobroma cacao]|nr:B3 DNA binding domain - like 10 [Theobroma cacao]
MRFFEKYLTKVDVKKQMAIPSAFREHLPRYEGGRTISFSVHDVSGNQWENFGYYIRRKGKDYAKPVFQKNWRKYARAKSLKPGDKIIFRVEENAANGAPRYTIAAQKKIVILAMAYFEMLLLLL